MIILLGILIGTELKEILILSQLSKTQALFMMLLLLEQPLQLV
jgi:hypothetical protein